MRKASRMARSIEDFWKIVVLRVGAEVAQIVRIAEAGQDPFVPGLDHREIEGFERRARRGRPSCAG